MGGPGTRRFAGVVETPEQPIGRKDKAAAVFKNRLLFS
jgi:hypothetical protein